MSRRRLALAPALEGERLAAEFGEHGLLFVSSGGDGLSVSNAPCPGRSLHAIFFLQRLSIFGVALSPSAAIEGGDGFCPIRDGAQVQIGARRLAVCLGDRSSLRRRGVGRALLAAAIACALAMALAPLFPHNEEPASATAPSEQDQSARPSDGSLPLPPLDARAAGLIEEAHRHLNEGRAEQARLALIEASEVQPRDLRIERLLEEVGRRSDEAVPEEEPAIETMVEEGLKLKREGDLPGARQVLDQALGIARRLSTPPPVTPAIEEARREVAGGLRDRFSPRVSNLRHLLEEAPDMEAPRAVRELARARGVVDEMMRSMPQEAEWMQLRTRIDSALTAATARWIAGAVAAETYAGCGQALSFYRAMAAALEGVDPARARGASEGIRRCQSEVEARKR